MRKLGFVVIILTIALAFAGCAQTDGSDDHIDEESSIMPNENTAFAEETPTPAPADPAELFAKEHNITLPKMYNEFVTDDQDIAAILEVNPCWTCEVDRGDGDEFGNTDIMYFAADGIYTSYNDFIGDLYIGGEWSIDESGLVITTMDGQTTTGIPVIAKEGDNLRLCLYYDEIMGIYAPSTQEDKLLVTTDTEFIAKFRSFLCSASWELRGHFDETGTLSDLSPDRVYTFLPDGQIVLKENGEYIKGRYILNADMLDYVLEDGQSYSSTIQVDSSTGISYIYLFPDFTRAECDVYWAISPRDVSDVVTEGEPIVQRKDIPYWTVNIGDAVVTSYELDENLEMADSTFNLMLADGTDEQVTATGYKLKSILEYLEIDVDEIQTITIVYTNGFERELTPFLMGEEQSLLVVKKEEGYLAAPMFGTLMILPDAGVAEIRVE